MAGVEDEVLATFRAQLVGCNDVPASVASDVAQLLAADKLPKPDQLVDIYAHAVGESVL